MGGNRPLTVTVFEAFGIAALCIDVLFVSELSWLDAAWFSFMLMLILGVSRRKSRIARWIFTAVHALMVPLIAYGMAQGLLRLTDMTLAAWLLTGAALVELGLLWSPPTSRWLSRQFPKPAAPAAT